MKQVIQHFRDGKLRVEDVPEAICQPGGILVDNVASLISAGTERMTVELARRSLAGKARARPDLVRQVWRKLRRDGVASTLRTVQAKLETPLAFGYSCAGTVREVGRGVDDFQVGDRVACAGMNYASHAETVFIPRNLAVQIPGELDFESASFVTLGAIALQGVRTAEVRLGESVAVVGLGLLGQLTIQILRAAGCRVIGIDLDPARIRLAQELGAEESVLRSGEVTSTVSRITARRGVDAVIITAAAGSNDPVELAAEIARDRAIVSVVGAVGLNIPRKAYYEKDLQLRMSRSYGPGRYDRQYEVQGIDYPIGYVRWTERRNMEEFLRLVECGGLNVGRLITHRFPIEEAVTAYELITGGGSVGHLGVVLSYNRGSGQAGAAKSMVIRTSPAQKNQARIGFGLIGAGNFAKSTLLPQLQTHRECDLVTVATASGRNARAVGMRFGFRSITTDYREVINNPEIDAVVIATRHDSHAQLTADALRAGKAVFVEKPLAIDVEALTNLEKVVTETGGRVLVGFNRRHSALAIKMKDHFTEAGPLAISYRVNAGSIPPESWIQSEEGGGRIVGECCHFIDLVQFITGSTPIEVHAVRHPSGSDTLCASLRFADGSICNLGYFANGDSGAGKERIEVFGAGRSALLDDFVHLELWRNGQRRRSRSFRQDKGFSAEVGAFIAALKQSGPMPIDWSSQVITTRTTFAIEESLRTGHPVTL